jgi:hypothetical protein
VKAWALLFVLLVTASSAGAASNATFTVVPTGNPSVQGNTLNAVAAVSSSDVWAVGFAGSNNLNESRTLIERWNGSAWSVVPSPNPGSTRACNGFNSGNMLNAVSGVSTKDVWAVGFSFSCSTLLRPLILHWNGKRWKAVPSPALNTNDNAALNGVVAFAKDNVWAVGYQPATNGAVLTLVEHWNGTSWSVVPSPQLSSTGSVLTSVAAVSPSDIWAVGDSVDAPTTSVQTLVEHYDGRTWKVIASPNPLPKAFLDQNVLVSVHAVSASNVWAVGHQQDFGLQRTLTLIEHWNGTSWTVVASPNDSVVTGSTNRLKAVTGFSGSNLYAVGFVATANTSGQQRNFAARFDGSTWSAVSTPRPGMSSNLNGADAITGTRNLWFAGAWSVNESSAETGLLQVPQTLALFSSNA